MEPLSTQDKVDLWKLDQLEPMGFNGDELAALLSWNADHREVKNLIDQGCPPHLVLEILKPLDVPVPVRPVSVVVDEAIQEYASIRV